MEERTFGIILRTRPLTETSLISNWLTQDFGRISTVAKGARRSKSPFRGKIDLFFLADFSFIRSRRSELHTLKEVALLSPHNGIRQDLFKLEQAAYASRLVEQTTEKESPVPEMFEQFKSFIDAVSRHPANGSFIPAFELKWLALQGLDVPLKKTQLSPAAKTLAEFFLVHDWDALAQLQAPALELRQLNQFLHGFLIYHLGRIPAGRNTITAKGGKVNSAENG
jgi:DNA repair protein RecO (recombination protein O)